MEFDIPVGTHGDCYDRQVVRMEEMRQSVRIMKQCVEKLNSVSRRAGAVRQAEDGKFAPPKRAEMKRSMESLIHHFKLYTEGLYRCRRARSMPQSRRRRASSACSSPPTAPTSRTDCKIRAPGFAHLQAMDFMCRKSHAGRRQRDPRLARHRVRRGRSMNVGERGLGMSVRRLAEKQPESFAFTPENQAWCGEAGRQISERPARLRPMHLAAVARAKAERLLAAEARRSRRSREMLDMPFIRALEVATFYTMFNLEPVGTYSTCSSAAPRLASLRGSEDIKDVLERRKIGPDAPCERRRPVLLARGRVPRRLLQCADGADQRATITKT